MTRPYTPFDPSQHREAQARGALRHARNAEIRAALYTLSGNETEAVRAICYAAHHTNESERLKEMSDEDQRNTGNGPWRADGDDHGGAVCGDHAGDGYRCLQVVQAGM